MNGPGSLFSDEERTIARAETLLSRSSGQLPASDFGELLKQYKKLYRQSTRLVKMGDRMQGQLNRLNDQLAKSEEKYRGIFESSIQGIFRLTPEGRFLDLNPAMARIFGYASTEDMLCCSDDIFLSPEQRSKFMSALARTGLLKDHLLELRRRDGSSIWVEICVRALFDSQGSLAELEGLLADVTEKRRMLKELQELARNDGLTGLYNRRYFVELGQRELLRAQRQDTPLSLVYFDADHFKRVNDTYGHDAGDRVLQDIARIGREHLRDLDVFGRIGGEEFAVLLPGTSGRDAIFVAEKLRRAFESHTVRTPQSCIRFTASFGVAGYQDRNISLDDMLKNADSALYEAKRSGRNTISYHRPLD